MLIGVVLPVRLVFFFFQAEDGIRDLTVTGVQTCALPILIRSHVIAPRRPARMTAKLTTLMSIMPDPTVFATAVPNVNAATKLKNAAQMTALPGESTRVDTTVAIEFAAS